jgi:mRNA-degrading endonuclease RelE of RelBE toxin-antitoxin system
MSYSIELSDNFKKEAKKLIKKYTSLKEEIKVLGQSLAENPKQGTSLGNNVYKIRLSIASKQKGKSDGARIITFIKVENETIYFLTIYSKGEKDTITDNEIKLLLENYI